MRLLTLATAIAAVLSCTGCGEDQRSDTSRVGADLLGSRGISSGAVPFASELDRGGRRAEPDLNTLGWEAGDTAAPVRVLEFSDFGCGYCRRFHVETWPTLRRDYVETGKVLWKFVPMELGMFGPNSEDAALAAECALAQDRFPAMAERLFGEQREWKRADDPGPVFRRLARDADLDVSRWESCMTEGDRRVRVRAGTDASRRLGVRGTPTFFLVGYGAIPGALPLETFRLILDEVYAQETGASG